MIMNAEELGSEKVSVSVDPANGDSAVSTRIISLRKGRSMTLQECAKLTGVAASTLSKIERGELSPTVTTLQKIAAGFELEVVDLLSNSRPTLGGQARRAVNRAGEGKLHTSMSCANYLLCHDLKQKRMVPIRTTVTAHSTDEYPVWPYSEAEIFLWVVSGRMELHTRVYEPLELGPGDSVYYDASGEHCWISVGEKDAEVVWVMTA